MVFLGLRAFFARGLRAGFSVFFSAKRRIHFESSFFFQTAIVKYEVVRSSLTSYVYAFCFRFSYKLNAFFSGNVANVISATCFLCKI